MSKIKKGNFGVIAAYLAVCIIWGSTYLAMRIAVGSFPPLLFAGIRFSLAGILVLSYAIIKKKEFPNRIPDVLKASIPGLFMLLGSNGLVMWAEQWVHSGITSLLLSTTPLFVAVIEALILKEKNMKLMGWCCLVVGFIGTAMLIITGAGVGSTDLKGGLLVLLAAFLWSLGSIYSKKAKLKGHIITQIGIQMLAAGLVLSLIGALTGEIREVQINISIILSLAYLVLFGSIIGYSSNMYVLSKWPASRAITSAYINPIIAVLLGVILLGESFSAIMVLFMILTLGSVVLLHLMKFGIFDNFLRSIKNSNNLDN